MNQKILLILLIWNTIGMVIWIYALAKRTNNLTISDLIFSFFFGWIFIVPVFMLMANFLRKNSNKIQKIF